MATSKASNLSPREQFQNSVRQLTSEELPRHRRNKSISLKYNPYELQHVSSLRVSPLRRSPYKAGPTSLGQVAEEPDFGTEERDIWSRRSPVNKAQVSQAKDTTFDGAETASLDQYQGHQTVPSPLQLHQSGLQPDSDERPKTRRGPSGPSAFETMAGPGNIGDSEIRAQAKRDAKFAEGTMTSRSGATASTWSDSEYATGSSEAEETESDATPKASRKRRSDSFDLRDFQPPTLTPSAIKRTLFGRREGKKDKRDKFAEPNTNPKHNVEGEVKKPKRRLRKSMSKLQFLGEKIKIFGSSSHDLPEQTDHSVAQTAQDVKSVLDERKRKAEAAYAEQFGSKKQRDNNGLANVTSSPELVEVQALHGNQKYDSSTVRCRGGTTRSRPKSTSSTVSGQTLARQGTVNEHDVRKRPSRRELEKENQQLRALLRVSQVTNEEPTTCASESESIPPVPPLRIRRKHTPTSSIQLSSDTEFVVSQDIAEPVPPVPPQHPDRRILGNVSNNSSRRSRRESFGIVSDTDLKEQADVNNPSNLLQNTPKLAPTPPEKYASLTPRRSTSVLPRAVSIIIEEPEDETEGKKRSLRLRAAAAGKENTVSGAAIGVDGRKEEWQWPEDVF